MRFINLMLLLVLSVILSVQGDRPHHFDEAEAPKLFEQYVKDFKKVYKDDKDKESHFEEFKKKLKVINDLNDKYYPTTTFGINQFTDRNKEEMKQAMGYNPPHELRSNGGK